MVKFCSKCGTKVEGTFCTNCGSKIGEEKEAGKIISNDVNDYLEDKARAKRNHDIYRLVVGIVMIIIGFCVFVGSLDEELLIEKGVNLDDINVTLALTLPGLAALAGGILSIIARKNNKMLLISGFCYVAAAICNVAGIQDVSLYFILWCIFAPLNFVFYSKTEKEK